ncbi:MAG: hypothetical protein JSS38_00920 [Nitrospira sp.]|nr:hypothetical protein [Nitrospira sp.]
MRGRIFGLLWADHEGFRDRIDGAVHLEVVAYVTMITVTTVGYGDIVPLSTHARLLCMSVIMSVRLSIWFWFLGTAYQLSI